MMFQSRCSKSPLIALDNAVVSAEETASACSFVLSLAAVEARLGRSAAVGGGRLGDRVCKLLKSASMAICNERTLCHPKNIIK